MAPTTVHVVFRGASAWRVYSIYDLPPGNAVALGGRIDNGPDADMMTITAPATSAMYYGFNLHDSCGSGLMNDTIPTMSIPFETGCAGKSYHLFVYAIASGGQISAIDAGPLTLAQGGSHTVTGTGRR
jgi:hypothetical protein